MTALIIRLAPAFWATLPPAELIALVKGWDIGANVAVLLEDPDSAEDAGPWVSEPSTAVGALVAATTYLQLILPVAAAYTDPVTAARRVGSLANLSAGRVGWFLDLHASPLRDRKTRAVSRPLGEDDPLARARELVAASRAIWDSWDRDAFRADKAANVLVDDSRIREVAFAGRHFRVHTLSNLRPPPQGNPALYVAPRDAAEAELAAALADVVLRDHGIDPSDIATRAAALGRAAPAFAKSVRIGASADLDRLDAHFITQGASHVA